MWQVFVHHLWGCVSCAVSGNVVQTHFHRSFQTFNPTACKKRERINTRSVTAINSMWPLKDRVARVFGSVEQSESYLQL